MEHLPKAIRKDISRGEEVEVSDWVKQALDKAVELAIHTHEERLANMLIQQAYDTAPNKSCSTGIALAAAFDLFVAAEYYKTELVIVREVILFGLQMPVVNLLHVL